MSDFNRLPGVAVRDRWFTLPVDHARPEGASLRVYAREAVRPGAEDEDLPWLVFLQGGPGFGSPRPIAASGWLGRALQDYRVLLLDQRGTGRSTPVSVESLARLGSVDAAARHLGHFRADAIVADCEQIRREVIGDRPWTVLGQSYGGFCSVRYLSAAPEGLEAAIITGGLPPLEAHPDEIYRATYRRCLEQNERYYARYPGDVEAVRRIADALRSGQHTMPGGGRLTLRLFQQLGLHLGMHDGHETIHYLVESAFEGDELTWTFRRGVEHALPYDTNPLFSLLHEACYTQGFASNWSAHRIRDEVPAFSGGTDDPVQFTGEMIYPWMFEDWARLRPLREASRVGLRDCR